MKRDAIDFHLVPDHQLAIHWRLVNWSRWCNGRPGNNCSPMFRGYRSTDVWSAPEIGTPVDKLDAAKVAKAVVALPEKHRAAVNWHYVKPVAPMRAARELAVSLAELAQLVRDGRQMMINRGC